MADTIKTSTDVKFDVLYADGTKYHAEEGVLLRPRARIWFFTWEQAGRKCFSRWRRL